MKRLLFTICLISFTTLISAQCLSGDCENGFGKIKFSDNSIYEGTFENKLPNGLGIFTLNNGNLYFGEFEKSKFKGFGFLLSPNGSNFIGLWEDSLQNGGGVYTDEKQNTTTGIWEKGVFKSAFSSEKNLKNPSGCEGNCFDGYGRMMMSKNIIQAIFKNGKPTFGRIFNRAEYTYDGEIKNGLFNGYGQINYIDGNQYFGYFKNGKKEGKGILIEKGKAPVYGIWENDEIKTLNMATFCNEIKGLPFTSQTGYSASAAEDETFSGKVIDAKFLSLYEINVRMDSDALYGIVTYVTTVSFPNTNTTLPIVTLNQINNALENCEKITKIANSKFTFKYGIDAYILETYKVGSLVSIRMTTKGF